MVETKQRGDLRDYLAAERTFLAWIRTGIALMGFGFVIARFGLFLRQMQFIQHVPTARSHGVSLWFGTAVMVAGIVTNLLAARHYSHVVRMLNEDKPVQSRPSAPAIVIALFLALCGVALAIYLFSVQDSTG